MELKNVKIENTNIFNKSGVSANGKEWKYKIILVKTDEEYPKIIAVQLWNKLADFTFSTDKRYNLDISIESREYQGKWFTEVKCFKLNETLNISTVETPEEPKQDNKTNDFNIDDIPPVNDEPFENKEDDDGLPF